MHRLKYLNCLAAAMALWPLSAQAENPASALAKDQGKNLSPSMRDDLEVIGRYAAEVNRRTQKNGNAPGAPAPVAAVPAPAPQEVERDPFEVSPQLKEGRSGMRFSGLPKSGALDLQRRIQIKAIMVTAQGGLAQLLVNGKDAVTVMDGELIDLGEMGTHQVRIVKGMVELHAPGAPEGKKVVLR